MKGAEMDISKEISTETAEVSEETAAETPKKKKGEGFKKFLNKLVGGDEQNVSFHFVLLMFFVLVAINMAFSYYMKVISVYNDELYYMSIARNIFNGNGPVIDIRGGGFEKILYSLLLVPTFLIKDALVRVNVISILNCVVVASSIFPVWFIAKDIKLSKKNTIIALIITLVFPDFALCTLFMSEVLYIPLVLWFIHVWFVCSQKPTVKNGVILGVVGYLCYFTKEVFLAVPVACVALEVVYPLIAYWTRDKSEPAKVREFYSGKKFLNLGIFLAVFAVMHIAVKFIFFRNIPSNVYSVGGIFDGLFTGYNILHTVYQVVYSIAAVMIAVLIVPVVYPIFRYRVLDDSVRKLYCFCVIALLATFAVTALTVGRNELEGTTVLRVLSRYFSSFVLLLLILFLKSIEKDFEDNGGKRRYWGVILLATVVPCFLFKGARISAPDTGLLDVYYNFRNSVGELTMSSEQLVEYFGNTSRYTWGNEVPIVIPLYVILFSALITLFVIGFHALYTHRREHQARMLSIAFIIILMAANSMSVRTYSKINNVAYSLTVSEVQKLNTYLKENTEPCNILYLLDGATSDIKRAMDTYLTLGRGQHIYPVLASELDIEKMRKNDFRSTAIKIEYLYFSDTPNPVIIENFDYIVVDFNAKFKTNKLAGIEKVEDVDTLYFTLYKNTNPSTVLLELDESKAFTGEALEIHFTSNNKDAEQLDDNLYFDKGYYNAPIYSETETAGSDGGCFDVRNVCFRVNVPVVGDYDTLAVKVETINSGGEFQALLIQQGGKVIGEGVIADKKTVELTAKVENGYLKFDVIFPKMPIYAPYTYDMLPDAVNMAWIKQITVSTE